MPKNGESLDTLVARAAACVDTLELEEAEIRAEVVVVAVAVELWRRQREPGLVGVVRDGEGEEERQHERRSPAFCGRT